MTRGEMSFMFHTIRSLLFILLAQAAIAVTVAVPSALATELFSLDRAAKLVGEALLELEEKDFDSKFAQELQRRPEIQVAKEFAVALVLDDENQELQPYTKEQSATSLKIALTILDRIAIIDNLAQLEITEQ